MSRPKRAIQAVSYGFWFTGDSALFYRQVSTDLLSRLDLAVLSSIILLPSVSTDLLSRLDGITNSLLFDKRGTISHLQIRGLSTLSSGAALEPLIVLDNFPYNGDINNVNPNDMENITILKDAATTSIW